MICRTFDSMGKLNHVGYLQSQKMQNFLQKEFMSGEHFKGTNLVSAMNGFSFFFSYHTYEPAMLDVMVE